MNDTPAASGIPRCAYGLVAAGGAAGAAVSLGVQTLSPTTSAGTSSFPVSALVSVVLGCLLAGALLGTGEEHRRSWWATAGFGLACGLTSLGGYAALGLTVTAGSASVAFLVLTPLAALAAGATGHTVARAITRRRSAERVPS